MYSYVVSLNFQSTYCNFASEIALKTHEIPKIELQMLIEFCWDKFDKKTLSFGFPGGLNVIGRCNWGSKSWVYRFVRPNL